MYVKPSVQSLGPGGHLIFTIKLISFLDNPINTETLPPEKCTFDHTLKTMHILSEGMGTFQRTSE